VRKEKRRGWKRMERKGRGGTAAFLGGRSPLAAYKRVR
jgi:hypothetical protein